MRQIILTKSEKEIILKAIYHIHSDNGDYYEGIHMLCALIGLRPPYILTNELQQLSLKQIKISKDLQSI